MTIRAHIYKDNQLDIYEDLEFLKDYDGEGAIWIDLETDDEEILNKLAEHFSLHELTIEDCLTPDHMPKIEDFGHYMFFIFRALNPSSDLPQVQDSDSEQEEADSDEEELTRSLSICLGKNYIITQRISPMPWLDAYLRQVKRRSDQVFEDGIVGLMHSLIDVLVDRFSRGLAYFENQIEELEDFVIKEPEEFDVHGILDLKGQLNTLRHITRDQRAIINRLANDPLLIKDKQMRRYFRDIEENAASVMNTIERQLDSLIGLRDVYFAMANVRLGDVMRVLAVITTLAVPLNLVVGLYGMNFDAIPLLHNPDGFWLIMSFMFGLALFMLYFFRRKSWI